MVHVLYIVTGAPGAGKSTTLDAFLRLHTSFVAFDIDWLTLPASHLAEKDVIFDTSTWPAYRALWFTILAMIARNHKQPIFFTAIAPQNNMLPDQPQWCTYVEWLLLDCDDHIRRHRLQQRPEWTNDMIEEAIQDAATLRQLVRTSIDTGFHAPDEIADMLMHWLEDRAAAETKLYN